MNITEYINNIGGYDEAKKKTAWWLINHGDNWRNIQAAYLLEYRRANNIYEPGDYVFLRDEDNKEFWVITNILDDGRIELKTGKHGYPVPTECWGMYYGMPQGLIHATDEEIESGRAVEVIAEFEIDETLRELFTVAVKESIDAGLFDEFCRLKGYTPPKSPIDFMIDKSTGRMGAIAYEFFDFVRDYVLIPVLDDRAQEAFK